MFTGIVEEIGEVRNVERRGDVMRLDLAARVAVEGSEVGASVAVNGVCLTVVTTRAGSLAFEVGPETLERTTLGRVKAGDPVNLERPGRLGRGQAVNIEADVIGKYLQRSLALRGTP